jgi:hypothetical protein
LINNSSFEKSGEQIRIDMMDRNKMIDEFRSINVNPIGIRFNDPMLANHLKQDLSNYLQGQGKLFSDQDMQQDFSINTGH